jgi:hypothetical protein
MMAPGNLRISVGSSTAAGADQTISEPVQAEKRFSGSEMLDKAVSCRLS